MILSDWEIRNKTNRKMRKASIYGIVMALILLCVGIMSFKMEKPEPLPQETEAGFSIDRVHNDMMRDMKIYKVTGPFGTKYVMWEGSKGGMCTLN